jgi:hypothetical protein
MIMNEQIKERIMHNITIVTPEQAGLIKEDPEFKDRIKPLTSAEHAQLEANIKAEGCRDPLTTWHDTLVDGYHRFEICKRLRLPFRRQAVDFTSREEVLCWIDLTQLGRRNLTSQQKKLLVGRAYNSNKPAQGGTGANRHAGTSDARENSASAIGKKQGMHEREVRRAGEFAQKVDADPSLAARVMRGEKIPPIKPKPAGASVQAHQSEVCIGGEIDKAIAELERVWTAATQDAREKFVAGFNPSQAMIELLRSITKQYAMKSQTGEIVRSAEPPSPPFEAAELPAEPKVPEARVDETPTVAFVRQIISELGVLELDNVTLGRARYVCEHIIKTPVDTPDWYFRHIKVALLQGNHRAKELHDQLMNLVGVLPPPIKPVLKYYEA